MKLRKTNKHTFAVCAYQESPFLEECILSLINQTVRSSIIVVTSTPSTFLTNMAEKYKLSLHINEGEHGITQDWNFAYSKADTEYVTIAHQDDLYDSKYTENLLAYLNGANNPLIFFTDYAEIREGETIEVVTNNQLLQLKRWMLIPLRNRREWGNRWLRRRILSFGNPICCPSVAFVKKRFSDEPFVHHFRADEDWEAWERISRLEGEFVYCNKILTYHRIHKDSETTKILLDDKRSAEDYVMFKKFWPHWAAKILTKLYSNSQKSNQLLNTK